jgi:hypothetical protein
VCEVRSTTIRAATAQLVDPAIQVRQKVGTLDSRTSVELPIEPGRHVLQLRVGRYSSANRSFDVSDGSVVSFRCNGARIWPIYLASFVKLDLAIWLQRK